MTSQAQEGQIIERLKIIDQYDFEEMVNSLVYQGAFPEIADADAFLEPFGTNVEKRSTIKSAPRADAEIRSRGLKIEKSTEEIWPNKLKQDVQKHKGEEIRFFAFFTNQDTGRKMIRVDRKSVDAEGYINAELGCEKSWVIGKNDLVLRMKDPKYFSIRRNYLNLADDFFCSASEYWEIIKRASSLKCETQQTDLDRYAAMLRDRLSFESSSIVILHNDDILTLLNVVGLWAINLKREQSQNIDFCCIRWAYETLPIPSIDGREVDDRIPTIVLVWNAHEIKNLADILRFTAKNVMLVFVTKTGFLETVRERIEVSIGNIEIKEVTIGDIDKREIGPGEKAIHQEKIKYVVQELIETMQRYEALVYFYSPFNIDDEQISQKIAKVLNIDVVELDQLRELLIKSDLGAITGRILWLKQPLVARELLSDFINDDTIPIVSLVS